MISGAHIIVYSKDAEADRAFFGMSLDLSPSTPATLVDLRDAAGRGGVPSSDANDVHELYFMCEDLKAEMAALAEKGVRCSDVQEAQWGSDYQIQLPGGGKVGLYQPKHPTAIGINI